MKVKKITMRLIAALYILLLLSGCAADNNDDEQLYAWPLATASTEDTITHVFATAFADEVYRLSDGKMKIQVYPQSTIGVDREILESMKDGDIPFAAQSPATQVAFMPQVCVFDAPSVFDSIEDARRAIDRPEFLDAINPVYLKSGYRLLGIADQGFRVMTSNRVYTGFESFKGQKIRTMENPFHLQFWKSLNANPTPMTFSEVYIGLQQGTIDAQENSYSIIVSAKLYEQQKYGLEIQAIPDFVTLVVSDVFYNELSTWQQKIIDEAVKNAQEIARAASDEMIFEKKQQLLELGMAIEQPDEETIRQIRAASIPVYDAIRAQAGDTLFESYTSMPD